jgi:hypothetical protein
MRRIVLIDAAHGFGATISEIRAIRGQNLRLNA